ncbi:MAG: hypothetical protein HUK01_01220 [Bacteroidaceae bacterium]|nr:hypothetical protein [Bacteroidaceae bacterium]
MLETVLVSIVLLAIAMLLLCVRILLKKGGRFRAQHIGQSRAMRERGIACVQSMDATERAKLKNKQNIK